MRCCREDFGHCLWGDCLWIGEGVEGRQGAELRLEKLGGAGKQAGNLIVEHIDLSPYHMLGLVCKSIPVNTFRKRDWQNEREGDNFRTKFPAG